MIRWNDQKYDKVYIKAPVVEEWLGPNARAGIKMSCIITGIGPDYLRWDRQWPKTDNCEVLPVKKQPKKHRAYVKQALERAQQVREAMERMYQQQEMQRLQFHTQISNLSGYKNRRKKVQPLFPSSIMQLTQHEKPPAVVPIPAPMVQPAVPMAPKPDNAWAKLTQSKTVTMPKQKVMSNVIAPNALVRVSIQQDRVSPESGEHTSWAVVAGGRSSSGSPSRTALDSLSDQASAHLKPAAQASAQFTFEPITPPSRGDQFGAAENKANILKKRRKPRKRLRKRQSTRIRERRQTKEREQALEQIPRKGSLKDIPQHFSPLSRSMLTTAKKIILGNITPRGSLSELDGAIDFSMAQEWTQKLLQREMNVSG